jgi:DNA-binding HxlR family transcriptional regulator
MRHSSAYAVLAAVCDYPCERPREIRAVLDQAASFRDGLGLDPLPKGIVTRRLAEFHDDGLVVRCDEHWAHGAHSTYQATDLGAGLIRALDPVGAWALDAYGHLVRVVRAYNGADLDSTIATRFVAPGPVTLRLAAELAFSLLSQRWAFGVLVFCSGEPMSPGALEDRINAGLDSNPDLAWQRHLAATARHENLNRLEHAGLLVKTSRPRRGRSPLVQYQTSTLGDGLLEALWQAGEWGLAFDPQLYRIMAARNGKANGD